MASDRRDSKRQDWAGPGSLPLDLRTELERLEQEFSVDSKKLKEISQRFGEELREGLEKNDSNIPMNVTWTLGFPSGHEKGEYMTVDLGGTKLRVCWIILKERKGETEVNQEIYHLPDDLKIGSADQLWSFIADSIEDFIEKHKLHANSPSQQLPLGFTFSYPAFQEYIDHGILQTWTKGFDIKGVEGEDVAQQLRDALAKRHLPISLVALINDTTGAMIASAYNDPETIIGAIFGTGCNAAYMENVGSIPKLRTSLPPETRMAINCEYGAFDNSHRVLPRTKYDQMIDAESPRPGEQTFEKMSAGLYLGEIFRLVMVELVDKGLAFNKQNTSRLREPYVIDTSFLSALEDDRPEDLHERFKDLLELDVTDTELLFSHRLAEYIAIRGARLCTCGVAAICRKKGIQSGHVAADGSVANKHPKFKQRWAQALGEVLDWPPDRKEDPIVITSAEDGSGIGAAVISAMTVQRANEGNTVGISKQ